VKVKDVIKNAKSTNPEDQSKKIEELGLQVGKLKSQIQQRDSELAALKEKQQLREANMPQLRVDGNQIIFDYTTRVKGKVFHHLQGLEMHANFHKLYALVKPLVNITNALVRGQDLFHREPRYEIGPDGKPDVNRRAKDAEGRGAFMPSSAERFSKQLNEILSLPGITDLLTRLDEEYQRILSESPKRSSKIQRALDEDDSSPETASGGMER